MWVEWELMKDLADWHVVGDSWKSELGCESVAFGIVPIAQG